MHIGAPVFANATIFTGSRFGWRGLVSIISVKIMTYFTLLLAKIRLQPMM